MGSGVLAVKTIYLFNDTGRVNHAGCRAVMRSIRRHLRGFKIIAAHRVNQKVIDYDAMAACDIVLVNGEGTIHHDRRVGNFLLEALRQGQEMGKTTVLVNALYQQYQLDYADVLKRLDFFAVRESLSAKFARRAGGKPKVLLDSAADPTFITYREPPKRPKHGILVGETHIKSPCHGFLEQYRDYKRLRLRGTLNECVAILRKATCYITGQHHGVYAAGIAGIPFVAIPSNSHKIQGLIQWSGLPIPICRRQEDLQPAIDFALENPEVFRQFQAFLASQRVFQAEDLAPWAI
jgi:hypothetical protein